MSPTPLWPASYPNWPGTMPPITAPHMPSTSCSASPTRTLQVEVPMIMTMVPGSTVPAVGSVTWASTFATATAVPGRNPVQRAASSVRPPARPPSGARSRDIFSSTTSAKSGCRAAK